MQWGASELSFLDVGIDFDGTDDFIDASNSASINLDGSMSVMAWIYPRSTANYTPIVTKEDWDNSKGYYLGLDPNDDNNIYFGFNRGGNEIVTSSDAFTMNSWYYVVGTFDSALGSNNLKIYVNNVLVEEGGDGTVPVQHTENLDIGYLHDIANAFFDGFITEIAVWDVALSTTEIAKLYSGGVPTRGIPLNIQPANLQMYLPLNDIPIGESADGDTFGDLSGNSNTATGDDGANDAGLTSVVITL